jgi:molecular chaperone Hsp33
MTNRSDHVVRAITDDGAFRVISVRSTQTVARVIGAQNVKGEIARALGDLVTASILVRELMAPDYRAQAILTAEVTHDRLVGDAHPKGLTRGLAQVAAGTVAFPFGARASLMVMRTLMNGAVQQGTVEVPIAGGVAAAVMEYLTSSEQVLCALALGTLFNDGPDEGDPRVTAAGGYVVQLLPETSREALETMTNRLQGFASIDHLLSVDAFSPESLLGEILQGMPFTRVGETPVTFGCLCSEERLTASLSTLPRADIAEIVAAGEVLEIACEYCGTNYHIAPERLRALLADN